MFNFFKKKPQGSVVTFKIAGMHCTSCGMNIDGELENHQGVLSASTSYAKATTQIIYNESLVSKNELKNIINGLGYQIDQLTPSQS